MRNKLIFWRDVPMDVDLGSFEFISNIWGDRITVVSVNGFQEERKICGWANPYHPNVETIVLSDYPLGERDRIAYQLIDQQTDAIHLFSGIRGEKQKYLDYYIKKYKQDKVLIIAEKTHVVGSIALKKIKEVFHFIFYKALCLKYRRHIKGFLTIGDNGFNSYRSHGWPESKLFHYMYNPKLTPMPVKLTSEYPVKFLYIGRFDKEIKGIDILMNAFDKLPPDGRWRLDLVGGYGKNASEVISWAKSKKYLKYLGPWDNTTICEKMSYYDVCVVPSKNDGWNLALNQSINASLGAIVTDCAGSDELIKYSGAGKIVPANNAVALYNAICSVICNPNTIIEWKKNAFNYQNKISPSSVGNYFIEILQYCIGDSPEIPRCPWRDSGMSK